MMEKKQTFYLQRFINAQDSGNVEYGTASYDTALAEIKSGKRRRTGSGMSFRK